MTITAFTRFVRRYGIYSDRRLFHAFVKMRRRLGLVGTGGMIGLWMDYNRWGRAAIIAAQDAHDLRETQNAACDRYDDGDGIRFDPHLDAYIG